MKDRMTISELIAKLEAFKREHGDLAIGLYSYEDDENDPWVPDVVLGKEPAYRWRPNEPRALCVLR